MHSDESARGRIFDVKRFALHDGPGIRTTVFLKGCPLDCWWCHNPESRSFEPEMIFRARRCRRCGLCVEACPEGALSMEESGPARDEEACLLCGACAAACPAKAREIVGRDVSTAEVLAEIERDVPFYDESGGGVTFSGGEPLAQPDFLLALLRACRARAIHTVVDTSGFAGRGTMRRVAGECGLFLYDLKIMDDGRHRRFCGVSNEGILENLRLVTGMGGAVIVRFPLVPGINDDEGNVRALAAFAASLPGPPPLDILPYERVGIEKYVRLSRTYRLPDTGPVPEERVAAVAAVLREAGLSVTVGGEEP